MEKENDFYTKADNLSIVSSKQEMHLHHFCSETTKENNWIKGHYTLPVNYALMKGDRLCTPPHPVIYTWMKGDELCNPLASHPPAIYTWNLNPLIYTWIKGDGLCDTSPPGTQPPVIYTWMKGDGLCDTSPPGTPTTRDLFIPG